MSFPLPLISMVESAAQTLGLPFAWLGAPFVVPAGPHVRAKIYIDDTRAAGVLGNRMSKVVGRIEFTVAVPVGEDVQAVGIVNALAKLFPRGQPLTFEDGTGTIMTPAKTPPASDGRRCIAGITINFYAFVKGDE